MRTVFLFVLWLCSFSIFAAAELTVFDHSGQKYGLSRDHLLSLPQKEITTTLPWVEGLTVYSGVTLQTVLENMDLPISSQVTFVALNDYKIAVPKEDFDNYEPIIAIKKNGEFMSVREKGPYWLIYPLSANPETNIPDFHAKMIWQIRDIHL
ncbi:hypothetical protein AB4455_22455 [Vibrio sp. 10N.261.46.E12]|uniref:hypothetical protein n=1 Tax=unclassified Vibrio TaxID=2614977 RepID=UPI000976EEDF|nr:MULTISPECIES: hypothetical protein [unclassified Vibrio]OMO32020.1 hypothetical protein BH584_17110 [Vibrio sp. 10N.261.45.E1]PMJ23604.1 hypothetical protein BCU27_15220 [Vibrio sp. 10N.286.45.B6]PML94775.1 hypothetical protein BCT66_23665 [Vibrio sp. 10N.261.49.E11]PMM65387.1 hypothetical protein BCT48_19275 [Vibrio sp. 10N.261.46.F12]PMM90443.1 hypothetical protein BCT46_23085 [Vibrio sp. 10N.261.46.E8]